MLHTYKSNNYNRSKSIAFFEDMAKSKGLRPLDFVVSAPGSEAVSREREPETEGRILISATLVSTATPSPTATPRTLEANESAIVAKPFILCILLFIYYSVSLTPKATSELIMLFFSKGVYILNNE